MNFLSFFTDPVLRAPTLGSMLMCLSSSLIGVLVLIRKRSLLGEALSHACYPGVVFSVILAATLFPGEEGLLAIFILCGAFVSSLAGLWLIDFLERRFKVKNDAALCFVLSFFFGVGILVASRMQLTHSLWYKQIQVFLYGQVATMTEEHVFIYGLLAALTATVLFFLYRLIQVVNFDRDFSKAVGISATLVDGVIFFLVVLAVVIGIRSVGVVLMSGMLIAPAVAARQWTSRLSLLFIFAGFIGLASGFLGNYFSLLIPQLVGGEKTFSLPTGPMILLTAATFCFFSLLCAPKVGLLPRALRIARFKDRCVMENILKAFWKKGEGKKINEEELHAYVPLSFVSLKLFIWRLRKQRWIVSRSQKKEYQLTEDGWRRASRIVRLHRLWEVYLVYLGQRAEKVHHSAEEMEHVITPEIEKELIELLRNPSRDPHHQPIPSNEGKIL